MRNRVVNGIDWHYEDRGSGPTLVLLHAFPLDHRLYSAQLDELSKWYRVIAPDLPGFGQTPWDKEFSIPWQAEQLHALLHAIDARACVIGGCSMGGYITLAYEQEYPAEVNGLLLIDTKAEGDGPEQRHNRDRLIEMVDRYGPTAVAEAMVPKMFSEQTKKAHPELEAQIRSVMLNTSAVTLKNALAALRDRPDRTDFLPSVACPALILVGQEDQVTPVGNAETMRAGIRHATLQVIPAAGHLAPMEQPAAVNEAIRAFVTSVCNR